MIGYPRNETMLRLTNEVSFAAERTFMSTAQWIEPAHNFSLPLPLPEAQVNALHMIVERMNDDCAGMIAVFAGCDAVGKLMAAEALAYEMQRTLHPIDKSEFDLAEGAHLARILEAAKSEEAILMLNDADGLPVSLLRKLEVYPGLSILAVDSAQESSTALGKSVHYVDFPFPFEGE